MTNKIEIIKDTAKYREKHIRYGQEIFNLSYKLYPKETNELRATEYDCFYDDDLVKIFLEKLNEKLENI
jgi:hypothetical protein